MQLCTQLLLGGCGMCNAACAHPHRPTARCLARRTRLTRSWFPLPHAIMSGVGDHAKGAAPLTSARQSSSICDLSSLFWKQATLSGERFLWSSRLNLAPALSSFLTSLMSMQECSAVLRTQTKRQHSGQSRLRSPRRREYHLPLPITCSTYASASSSLPNAMSFSRLLRVSWRVGARASQSRGASEYCCLGWVAPPGGPPTGREGPRPRYEPAARLCGKHREQHIDGGPVLRQCAHLLRTYS